HTSPGTPGNTAERQKAERQHDRQESADGDAGKHRRAEDRRSRHQKVLPVQTGHDEDKSEGNGNDVPNQHPALETTDEIARKCRKKEFHRKPNPQRFQSGSGNGPGQSSPGPDAGSHNYGQSSRAVGGSRLSGRTSVPFALC